MKRIVSGLLGVLFLTTTALGGAAPASADSGSMFWDPGSTPPPEPECTFWDSMQQDCEDTYLYRQIQAGIPIPEDPIDFRNSLYAIKLNTHGTYVTLMGVRAAEATDPEATAIQNAMAVINSSTSQEQFKCYRSAMQYWAWHEGRVGSYVRDTNAIMKEGFTRLIGRSLSYGGRTPIEEWSTPENPITYNDVTEILPGGWVNAFLAYLDVMMHSAVNAKNQISVESTINLSTDIEACSVIGG